MTKRLHTPPKLNKLASYTRAYPMYDKRLFIFVKSKTVRLHEDIASIISDILRMQKSNFAINQYLSSCSSEISVIRKSIRGEK